MLVLKCDQFSTYRALTVPSSDPIFNTIVVVDVIIVALQHHDILIFVKLCDANDTVEV